MKAHTLHVLIENAIKCSIAELGELQKTGTYEILTMHEKSNLEKRIVRAYDMLDRLDACVSANDFEELAGEAVNEGLKTTRFVEAVKEMLIKWGYEV